MKMTISYSSRVRRYKNIEIRIHYRSVKSRVATSITNGNVITREENIRYDKKVRWYRTWLFNYYMLTKNEIKGNQLLDKLLEQAKSRKEGFTIITLKQLVESIDKQDRKDIAVEGIGKFGMQYDRLDELIKDEVELREWKVIVKVERNK